MTRAWRPGEYVRCKEDLGPGLAKGTIVQVARRHQFGGGVLLVGEPSSHWWYDTRFESIPAPITYDAPKTRFGYMPGDRVLWRMSGGEEVACRVVCEERYRDHVRVTMGYGSFMVEPSRLRLAVNDDPGDPVQCTALRGVRIERRGPLADLGLRSHDTARSKGFYDDLEYARKIFDTEYTGTVDVRRLRAFIEQLWLLARCSLIHSEVSEAVEAIRKGELKGSTHNGKPEGLPSELADVLIRVADLAQGLGIDLDAAVAEKARYNAGRPHMHGKKA